MEPARGRRRVQDEAHLGIPLIVIPRRGAQLDAEPRSCLRGKTVEVGPQTMRVPCVGAPGTNTLIPNGFVVLARTSAISASTSVTCL